MARFVYAPLSVIAGQKRLNFRLETGWLLSQAYRVQNMTDLAVIRQVLRRERRVQVENARVFGRKLIARRPLRCKKATRYFRVAPFGTSLCIALSCSIVLTVNWRLGAKKVAVATIRKAVSCPHTCKLSAR